MAQRENPLHNADQDKSKRKLYLSVPMFYLRVLWKFITDMAYACWLTCLNGCGFVLESRALPGIRKFSLRCLATCMVLYYSGVSLYTTYVFTNETLKIIQYGPPHPEGLNEFIPALIHLVFYGIHVRENIECVLSYYQYKKLHTHTRNKVATVIIIYFIGAIFHIVVSLVFPNPHVHPGVTIAFIVANAVFLILWIVDFARDMVERAKQSVIQKDDEENLQGRAASMGGEEGSTELQPVSTTTTATYTPTTGGLPPVPPPKPFGSLQKEIDSV